MVATGVIVALVDAGQAGDAGATKVDDVGSAHVEDVGRGPAPVVELVEVVRGLVVASDCSTASGDVLRNTFGMTGTVQGLPQVRKRDRWEHE